MPLIDQITGQPVIAEADQPTFDALQQHLTNRAWRMDHLYLIQDAHGSVVRFKRNPAQMQYWREMWFRNIILKARQLGFSTEICIKHLDDAVFNSNTACGLVDYNLEDAKKKLAKIKFAYDALPPIVREKVALKTESTSKLEFTNGSAITVGTTHTGSTLQSLHVSELGRISAERPDKAKDIKIGSFGTVHAGQLIHVESTARGSGGEFADLVKVAGDTQKEGRPLTPLDFKLHFFGWHRHADYRLTIPTPITADLNEYFEELKHKHGVTTDLHQRWWYAAQHNIFGPDDIKSEYPSTVDECFFASIEGAYFKRELSKARLDGRIGKPMPFDTTRRVHTCWDIGLDDETVIWFFQTDGLRYFFIDYYECSGEGADHFAKVLREKADELGYIYGTHYLPHDVEVREWGSKAKPRIEILKELNVKPIETVPAVADKADAIEPTRRFLNLCWFDVVRCSRGVQCLDNYRKEWDERRAVWRAKPLHDWASHAADALMTGVVGVVPDATPEKRERRRSLEKKSSITSWSA